MGLTGFGAVSSTFFSPGFESLLAIFSKGFLLYWATSIFFYSFLF